MSFTPPHSRHFIDGVDAIGKFTDLVPIRRNEVKWIQKYDENLLR